MPTTRSWSSDDIFWRAVRNTITWACFSPLIEVSVALMLALALYAKVPGARFFRVAWFTPVLMSYVVVGILWLWIYNFDWGPVNAALARDRPRRLGAGLARRSQNRAALPDFRDSWMWVGFNMVVLLAALHSLPQEVLEAAELDNCGWGGKLVFVIFPLLRATLLNLIVLSFIGKMKIFDLVWITTKGNPLWATETVSTYVYKRAFEWTTFDLGYPSTIAAVWFVIVLVAVLTADLDVPATPEARVLRRGYGCFEACRLIARSLPLHGLCGGAICVGGHAVSANHNGDPPQSFCAAQSRPLGQICRGLVHLQLWRLLLQLLTGGRERRRDPYLGRIDGSALSGALPFSL